MTVHLFRIIIIIKYPCKNSFCTKKFSEQWQEKKIFKVLLFAPEIAKIFFS